MAIFDVLIFIAIIAFLARWSRGARENASLNPQHTAELVRLREEVDQLGAQLLRLQDEQSFMMRLLTRGDAAEQAPPPAAEAPDPTTNPENS